MRLFLGWPLSAAQKLALAARIARLQPVLPRASWVKPEALHLTLAFLGETDSGRVPALVERLGALGSKPAIPAVIATSGFFPSAKRARVAWVGVHPAGPIRELADAVRVASGAETEERAFHPHVTLARLRSPWGVGEAEHFQQAFEDLSVAGMLDRVVLFESRLSSAGAQHRPLHEVLLAPAPGGGEPQSTS